MSTTVHGAKTPEKFALTPDHLGDLPETAPLVFVDVETDGLRPDCKVWEVAIIRRDSTGVRARSWFVDVDVSQAETRALAIGGYYDRHPSGLTQTGRSAADRSPALPEERVAELVAQWTHGAHLVGVNPAFDAERLDRLLRRHGYAPTWHYHLVDVLALAAAKLQQPPPWKSDDLAAALGVEVTIEDRHTALGDARWAARIYDAVMGGGPR